MLQAIHKRNYPVCIHVLRIGTILMIVKNQSTTEVENCCFDIKLCVVFTTRQLLPAIKKNVPLPSHHCSNVRLLNNTSPNLSLIASFFDNLSCPYKVNNYILRDWFFHESAIIGQHAMRCSVWRQ